MFPEKFVERMKSLLGESEYAEFESSFDENEERIHALRVNGLKVSETDKADVICAATGASDGAKKLSSEASVPWENQGYYYGGDAAPGKHPYHEAGLYYIQEPSAMAPVHFLDPQPGERVLDLCAAPGGKSTQIAGRLRGQGLLVTSEINRDRAKILSLNIERMGISNALVLNEDPGHLSSVFEGYFDKILVDAPCSGEGMFRKNDNATDEWSEENVRLCAERQEEILDYAAKMLLPGGRLVYSTCTFSPEEDEQNVAGFLVRHPDFHVEKVEMIGGMEAGRPQWVAEDVIATAQEEQISAEAASGGADSAVVISADVNVNKDRILEEVADSVRLWPHKVHGEGHFLCVFKRDGQSDATGTKSYIPGGRNPAAKKDIAALFKEFAKETLNTDVAKSPTDTSMSAEDGRGVAHGAIPTGMLFSFGEQLYLLPENMPGINGLKVMRPGLHLGTVKKDRFEPSHALALYLKPENVRLTVDFKSDSMDIRQFLNGQSIRVSSEERPELTGKKGWCLVTCDGYSIGWAKLAGGMLKNHYPKGLRINY